MVKTNGIDLCMVIRLSWCGEGQGPGVVIITVACRDRARGLLFRSGIKNV